MKNAYLEPRLREIQEIYATGLDESIVELADAFEPTVVKNEKIVWMTKKEWKAELKARKARDKMLSERYFDEGDLVYIHRWNHQGTYFVDRQTRKTLWVYSPEEPVPFKVRKDKAIIISKAAQPDTNADDT
jgi:hypothetical protein